MTLTFWMSPRDVSQRFAASVQRPRVRGENERRHVTLDTRRSRYDSGGACKESVGIATMKYSCPTNERRAKNLTPPTPRLHPITQPPAPISVAPLHCTHTHPHLVTHTTTHTSTPTQPFPTHHSPSSRPPPPGPGRSHRVRIQFHHLVPSWRRHNVLFLSTLLSSHGLSGGPSAAPAGSRPQHPAPAPHRSSSHGQRRGFLPPSAAPRVLITRAAVLPPPAAAPHRTSSHGQPCSRRFPPVSGGARQVLIPRAAVLFRPLQHSICPPRSRRPALSTRRRRRRARLGEAELLYRRRSGSKRSSKSITFFDWRVFVEFQGYKAADDEDYHDS